MSDLPSSSWWGQDAWPIPWGNEITNNGPISGTLSVTVAGDSLSATTTVLVNGTLSVTPAADSVSAVGTVLVSGTLTATTSNSINATGTVLVSGTLVITQDSETILAIGSVSISPAPGNSFVVVTVPFIGTILPDTTVFVTRPDPRLVVVI